MQRARLATVARRTSRLPPACLRVMATAAPREVIRLGRALRDDFPILKQTVHGGKPLVYLDNAATSQKPTVVLESLAEYYRDYNSHIVAPVHALSARSTTAYKEARQKVAKFVNAASWREIVYTRNASEAINLVANAWGLQNMNVGDEVVLSVMEHHSNLVPWQVLAQKTGCVLRFVGLTEDECLDMAHMRELVGPRTKLVAISHVSNVLGCVNPVDEIVELAKGVGAKVLLDTCQSLPHMKVDVQALGADWIVASSHKMCGPSGIGFLWGKLEVLEAMPPYQVGGEMIKDVYLNHSTYALPPLRFEAGTPPMAEAIGLGAACDYLMALGMDNVHAYEQEIGNYLYQEMAKIEGVKIFGPPPSNPGGRAALCTFLVQGMLSEDITAVMDQGGIAIRSGHHCTQPLHRALGADQVATARASLYIYNTKEEVDVFVTCLQESVLALRGKP